MVIDALEVMENMFGLEPLQVLTRRAAETLLLTSVNTHELTSELVFSSSEPFWLCSRAPGQTNQNPSDHRQTLFLGISRPF